MKKEKDLVKRAKYGDAKALNRLLDNNKSYIYAIAFSLLKNHEDAEDAVQKTMIAVWQSIGSLENTEAFKSWLYRIAHTRSLNILQSRKKEHVVLDDDIGDLPQLEEMESELMLPQAYAERDDLRERLDRIIDGLSAVQRETIVLYYFNDRSIAEIAEIMDCSENTVKSRLYLARQSIKTEIEEQERKSGEKFFGAVPGAIPLKRFVVDHIGSQLPLKKQLTRILKTAERLAKQGAPAASKTTAVTATEVARTAAKASAFAAAKTAAIAVGVILLGGSVVGTVMNPLSGGENSSDEGMFSSFASEAATSANSKNKGNNNEGQNSNVTPTKAANQKSVSKLLSDLFGMDDSEEQNPEEPANEAKQIIKIMLAGTSKDLSENKTLYCRFEGNVDGMSLFSRATAFSDKIDEIHVNDTVEYINTVYDFYYVKFNGQKGYVRKKYFAISPDAPLVTWDGGFSPGKHMFSCADGTLHLRKTASFTADSLADIPAHGHMKLVKIRAATVTYEGGEYIFDEVEYNGQRGYVPDDCITDDFAATLEKRVPIL